MRFLNFLFILVAILYSGEYGIARDHADGTVIVFHAGSLSVPFEAMEKIFEKAHPGVDIQREASGSQKAARKISELNKPCDIMASADYWVIDKLLVPEYATWNIQFASNRMVLCYTPESRRSSEVKSNNWYTLLMDKNIQWGHSDPDLDPCGYRALMVMQLAEKHYKISGLYQNLLKSLNRDNIRPKSVELISLLQTGNLDYAWEYVSVAEQHHLKYVAMPDPINLGDVRFEKNYCTASVRIAGEKPGATMMARGGACIYGITLLNNAPNRQAALLFLEYVLDPEGGLKILKGMGQPVLIPCRVRSRVEKKTLPERLKRFVSGE
ncbi:MAG TPA: tungstate ABC transporter substrate-binding protein WtpA [Spirochaetota bacterium]|nr:tungstate ABC transporter substrate-binding protein WtpA [Spirochaetota bacterium]HPI87890.1 tungstate ABC transporter substrate-binding protein WtpA [Spirochaetota bacterium]HPR47378.1 tungstate ABC transporter substrate-binding protein WtpA [Spirochaetota bacterium]